MSRSHRLSASRRTFLHLALGLVLLPLAARAEDLAYLQLYSGWAGPGGGFVYGRVHWGEPPPLPNPGESSWRRLMDNVTALETKGLANAAVTASGVPGLQATTSTATGFVTIKLPAGLAPGFVTITVSAGTRERKAPPVSITVPVWDGGPGFAVVSDIDDTVTDTGVTHKWTMIKNTLLNSPFTMKSFPGTSAALATAAGKSGLNSTRPLFYLSGSPWPLEERITEFFDLQGYPRGSITLRRYSAESLNPFEFKHPHILRMVDAFPAKRFILLGDSGEKDPEVYAAVMKERPGRVEAVYIHNVTKEKQSSKRFAGMKLFTDWPEAAKDMRARSLAP